MKRLTAVTISLLIVLTALAAFAQEIEDRKAKRDRINAKVEELRKEILISKVGLTESEVAKIMDINKKYRDKRRSLFKERLENRRALSKALKEETVNESELKSILNKRTSLDDEMTGLRKQEEKEISKLLTTEEFANYILFNERFNRQMRGLVSGNSSSRVKRDNRTKDK
jgi:Spy/CpxP family protein refolding chaperone